MNVIVGLFGRAKNEHKVFELARSYTTEAIDTLVDK
jgi:phage gp46-like protein